MLAYVRPDGADTAIGGVPRGRRPVDLGGRRSTSLGSAPGWRSTLRDERQGRITDLYFRLASGYPRGERPRPTAGTWPSSSPSMAERYAGRALAVVAGERDAHATRELDARGRAPRARAARLGVGRGRDASGCCARTGGNGWPRRSARTRLGRAGRAPSTPSRKAWDLEYMLAHSRDGGARLRRPLPLPRLRRDAGRARARARRARLALSPLPAPARGGRDRDAAQLPGSGALADVVDASGRARRAARSAADDAFVLYTSGSSARPKAVPLQHYAVDRERLRHRRAHGPERRRTACSCPSRCSGPTARSTRSRRRSPTAPRSCCRRRFEPTERAGADRAPPLHRRLHAAEHDGALLGADSRLRRERVASLRTGLTHRHGGRAAAPRDGRSRR